MARSKWSTAACAPKRLVTPCSSTAWKALIRPTYAPVLRGERGDWTYRRNAENRLLGRTKSIHFRSWHYSSARRSDGHLPYALLRGCGGGGGGPDHAPPGD